jgi:hypothetical protein
MKSVYTCIATLCLASTCAAAPQLVKEEDGLRQDWLDGMHANWEDSTVVCQAKRSEDPFIRAYLLPASVTLDELVRININVDFDALQRLADIAFTYDRATNKSRLYASKPGLALPEQLQNALPGPGVSTTEAADRNCKDRPRFSVGPGHDGQLTKIAEEHLKSVDGGKTVYQLDGFSLPVDGVTDDGQRWSVRIDLGAESTTARDLVERGKELVRSIVGPGMPALVETTQLRPSPFQSGRVENTWAWELDTVEGEDLLVVVDWQAPRTADKNSAIVRESATATLIVTRRWR